MMNFLKSPILPTLFLPTLCVSLVLCSCKSSRVPEGTDKPASVVMPADGSPGRMDAATKPPVSPPTLAPGNTKPRADGAEVSPAAQAAPAKKTLFSWLKGKPKSSTPEEKPPAVAPAPVASTTAAAPVAVAESAAAPVAVAESAPAKKGLFSWLKRQPKPENAAPVAGVAAVASAPSGEKRGFFSWFKRSEKTNAATPGLDVAFAEECRKLSGPGGTVTGRDGWLYSASELSRAAGSGSSSSAVSAISAYASRLRGIGTELIVVPVPAKVHVYPDKISKTLKMNSRKPQRVDSALESALRSLNGSGVATVDLVPAFMAARGAKSGEPMLRTGQGWSPEGAVIAAREIASAVKRSRAGSRIGTISGITSENSTISFTGGLASGAAKVKPEVLPVRTAGRISGEKMRSISFKENGGTVLLMGDGNILAWREGNNPQGSSAAFASLADQVAVELEIIPDVLFNASDPRNAPRMRIMRERTAGRGTLSGTRALIWVFPAPDLLSSGWRHVPLQVSLQLQAPQLDLQLQ